MLSKKQALSILKTIIKYLRKREIEKAKSLFHQLIDNNVQLTPELINQIYDLGEVFRIFKEPLFFLAEIDKKLKVVALNFSEKAREKLLSAKCEVSNILDEIKSNPSANGIKIIK